MAIVTQSCQKCRELVKARFDREKMLSLLNGGRFKVDCTRCGEKVTYQIKEPSKGAQLLKRLARERG